ncbi:blastula protease 10-like [Amphibalanus amphitrite]|nr:blastula protease 10-like [Amphibalanus amphitrite]
MLVSSLLAAASATILNDTSLPPPDPFYAEVYNETTLPPPEPFEEAMLASLDPLERQLLTSAKGENGVELFEGDIMLSDEQRESRKGASNLWPGSIYYVITSSSSADRNIILSAINHWRSRSCLRFYERPESYNSGPHLRFIRSSGCWSYVGRQERNTGQSISIGQGCNTLGIIAHEIGHAIGFWHEQSRRDRDSYISVLTENILSGKEHNFRVENNENALGVPYDLSSLMHYGGFSFSSNGQPTIVTNDVLLAGKIGQRNGLSHRDRHLANEMYRCSERCVCIPRCRNGGFVDRNCRCICPAGTSGMFCDRRYYSYYGRTCGNQRITRPGVIKSRYFPSLYPPNEHCIWKVTAPTGKRVRIQFHTARVIYRSGVRCPWDWIAVHTNSDSRPDRVACGTELQNTAFTTTGNRLVVEMHSFRERYASLQTGFNATITFV